jgi:hypothetical protein
MLLNLFIKKMHEIIIKGGSGKGMTSLNLMHVPLLINKSIILQQIKCKNIPFMAALSPAI